MGMIILNGKEYTSAPKDGFPPIIYSDEEREVGVWRDGKPLYQRSFPFTININTGNRKWYTIISNSDITSIGMDTLLFVPDGSYIVDCGDGTRYSLPDSTYNNNGGALAGIARNDSGNVSACIGSLSQGNTSGVVTLRYTKTTDTPGSGKYTTYGGLAHHYSTSEQVVGTWIDGKPLYEKVITLTNTTSIPANTWTTIYTDSLIGNISQLIKCLYINSGNGGVYDDFMYKPNGNNLQAYKYGFAFDFASGNKFIIQYTKTTD